MDEHLETSVGRPQLHFTAAGWINDPHAVTYRDGLYHVFFQYVPGSADWRLDCHWGHASGPDLFSLTEHPPALTPGDDDDGIWSGTIVRRDDGSATILYTAVTAGRLDRGRIRAASPLDDDWLSWGKGEIVSSGPDDLRMFRDPSAFRDGDQWTMIAGASTADGHACIVSYSSSDGRAWNGGSIALSRSPDERDPIWTGSMWECPHLTLVDGQHVLIVSVWDEDELFDVVYAIGEWDGQRFLPKSWGRLSYGPAPYAATVFHDAKESPCVMFWLRGTTGAGWAGAHSIPYRMRIEDGALRLSPHPDLLSHVDPAAEGGTAADVAWTPSPGDELTVESGSDRRVPALFLRRTSAGLDIVIGESVHEMPAVGEVRIIVDGSLVEITSAGAVFGASIPQLHDDWRITGADVELRRFSDRDRP